MVVVAQALPLPSRDDRPRSSPGRALLGFLVGWIVAAWLWSLRLRVVDETGEEVRSSTRPWVLVFFHGTQVPLLAWRRRRKTAVLVSWSRDGEIQSRVMARAGMHVVRGSSSRGGVRGLVAMVRALRAPDLDAAFAVDGPRGPYGVVHPGAAACAQKVGGVLVPIGSAATPSKVLLRAWDRMALPWPFARAVVVLGPALAPDASPEEIAAAVEAVNARATLELCR
jgi:lysophospholipid acyltransferase (LPLAT)-like uncharacterized protein